MKVYSPPRGLEESFPKKFHCGRVFNGQGLGESTGFSVKIFSELT